jgi:MvaI/BcnI restriction endonuclease family
MQRYSKLVKMDNIQRLLNNIKLSDKVEIKQEIKNIFDQKLRNKSFINTIENNGKKHCGNEGEWIEKQFKIDTNSNTNSDFHGFEIKKKANKITFGDWSADEYIFKSKDVLNKVNNNIDFTKEEFLKIFGNYNKSKERYSWSGEVCPSKYNVWTNSGQCLTTNDNNDMFVVYSFSKDKRNNDNVPEYIKKLEFIILAYWNIESIDNKISKKFNNLGTVIVNKDKENKYNSLYFCSKIDIDLFMQKIKEQVIIFDSGMYAGNSRNYSQFRAGFNFWKSIMIEEY